MFSPIERSGRFVALVALSVGFAYTAAADLLRQMVEAVPAYRALSPQAHTPAFRIEAFPPAPHAEGTEWFWIYDGPQRIGLIQTWTKEIEMFRFDRPPDGEIVEYTIPAIHHWATLVGAKINIYAPAFLPQASFSLEWIAREGAALEFKTIDMLEDGTEGENTYRLVWDETFGYVWHCTTHYRLKQPSRFEFNNLLAGGISESRDDRKRWQKTLRGNAPGRITWFYHNPLNTPKDQMVSDGFVGFVREPDMNPFVALESVNAPVELATCSQWYDEHIYAVPEKPEADGHYHVRARYRFFSLPASIAAELENKATSINADGRRDPGFLAGVVNDFTEGIDGNTVYNGALWQGGRHIALDRGRGRSGNVSMKVTGAGKGQPRSASPIGGGTGIYGESAKRYRLSAWVVTDLTDGEAYIEVDDCFWSWRDVRATRRSRGLSGDTDWTKREIEFQPGPDDPFLLIKLVVDGDGSAWFDDLALIEIGEELKR